MEEEIAAYRRRCGRLPAAVLLDNHGLFVAAPEVEECLSLSKRITDAGRRFLGRGRVNPLEFPALIPPAFEEAAMWEDLIRDALIQGGSAPVLLRRDRSPIADEFLRNPRALRAARKGAFTPDQIVYCRTCPLFLRIPEVVTSERDVDVVLAKAAEAVAEYRRRWKLDPRVVIVPGFGVYSAAPDLAQLRVVADVYRAALGRRPRGAGPTKPP